MPYRPSIPDDTHKRVKLANIDTNTDLNKVYIEAIEAIYNEDGSLSEPFRRLEMADENLDLTDSLDRYQMLEIVVSAMFNEDGEPKPKAKHLFEMQKNKLG